MRQFEKERFLKELEKNGEETVRKNILSGKYGSEYLKLAKSWIKAKEYKKMLSIRRKRVLIALGGVSLTVLTIIITLLLS